MFQACSFCGRIRDLLRSYCEQFRSAGDVALELPTGTGKMLVDLLLAEWRRLYFRERALNLCPTRQLCHQVGAHAEQYGIRAHVLVGPGEQFPPAAYADYLAADAVAITTYSGIFNYRPRLTDPSTIVLDDAHVGLRDVAKATARNETWRVRDEESVK